MSGLKESKNATTVARVKGPRKISGPGSKGGSRNWVFAARPGRRSTAVTPEHWNRGDVDKEPRPAIRPASLEAPLRVAAHYVWG